MNKNESVFCYHNPNFLELSFSVDAKTVSKSLLYSYCTLYFFPSIFWTISLFPVKDHLRSWMLELFFKYSLWVWKIVRLIEFDRLFCVINLVYLPTLITAAELCAGLNFNLSVSSKRYSTSYPGWIFRTWHHLVYEEVRSWSYHLINLSLLRTSCASKHFRFFGVQSTAATFRLTWVKLKHR